MVLRKFTLFLAFLFAFILLGSGCKSKAPPQDIAGQPEQETQQPQADAGREAEPEPEARADSGVSKPDASVIPEGWQIYRNPDWGIERLAYPEGWYSRERTVEETGNANALWVDFNLEPIEQLIGADPVYPIALVISTSTLEDALDEYLAPDLKRETVVIGGKTLVRISYTADLIEARVVAFLYESNGLVYDISGPESLPELATVVASLVTRR